MSRSLSYKRRLCRRCSPAPCKRTRPTRAGGAGGPGSAQAASLYPPPKRRRRWSGGPMQRSLPAATTATRLARLSASSIACVVSSIARPVRQARMTFQSCRRVAGSRPDDGSSSSTTAGREHSATAIDKRRFWPPERRLTAVLRFSYSSTALTKSFRCFF